MYDFMDNLILSPSWPAAPRSGTILVQHPAWEAARNAVLDLAAEGPVTVFLIGEPGCGKTWLLRELEASLGHHGFPTMMLPRGDLPIPLSDGAAVLVDEARYMPDETRAMLATQSCGVVVLADIEPFEGVADSQGLGPVLIHLRLLEDDEVGPFASDWLQQDGLSAAILDPGGLSRLIEHSGGAVRLVAQLLTAAVALSRLNDHAHLTEAVIDEAAAFRLGVTVPLQAAPNRPIVPSVAVIDYPNVPSAPAVDPFVSRVQDFADDPPAKRFPVKWAVVGTAIAASVLAAVVLPRLLDHDSIVGAAAPATARLPALRSAEIAAPDVASPARPIIAASRTPPEPKVSETTVPTPTVPEPIAPVVANDTAPTPVAAGRRPPVDPLPPVQAASVPAPAAVGTTVQSALGSVPAPALAQAAPPQAVSPPALPASMPTAVPQTVVAIPQPTVTPVITEAAVTTTPAIPRHITAGLVLVAQRGDTLERLYDSIYRDRHAPPFAEIRAANPRPLKPGSIIVFPEPIGGWGRPQR